MDSVTPAAKVTTANQGALLKEMFDELGLRVQWDPAPPPSNLVGGIQGVATDEKGAELPFFIQLPGPADNSDLPETGTLMNGTILIGDMNGGPSFLIGHSVPVTDAKSATDEKLGTLVTEGLCQKFAGRDCGTFNTDIDV